jgi:hypothetical protein
VIVLSVRGSVGAPDSAFICYEPSGATLQGVSAGNEIGFTFTQQNVPITFTVTRSVSGELRGVPREILFPAGGTARFRY